MSSSLCFVNLAVSGEYRNVAAGKETRQSSNVPAWTADLAVDGSLLSCAETQRESSSFWLVDLGEDRAVTAISINTGQSSLHHFDFVLPHDTRPLLFPQVIGPCRIESPLKLAKTQIKWASAVI